MIRPPLDALRHRSAETFAIVILLATAFVLPSLTVATALSTRATSEAWLANYRPVIYLARQSNPETTRHLIDELEGWTLVSEVVHRTPPQALGDLEKRLGPEEVRRLGIKDSMLPHSLIIEPALPLVGHIELVSRVAGLEARMEVTTVDIPSALAMRTLTAVRWLLMAGLAIILVFMATAVFVTASFLRALQERERQEWLVLELFGAALSDMRHPAMVRGLTVGVAAGALGTVLHATLLGMWQHYGAHLVGGVTTVSAGTWLTLLIPLLAAPIVGFLAGWFASPKRPLQITDAKMLAVENLLIWRRNRE